jgi:dihydroorotase-like cyclic amidohydrolase
VTAEGSYPAAVLVEDEKVAAVGTNLDADSAETVEDAGKLVMPGLIDAHTHMDMPFGATVTADDWATGTEAAAAGGTTMLIDFALQEEGGTLAGAYDAWDPELSTAATLDDRHGNVDYTPYGGRSFTGGPAAVYVRGNPVYRDGEVVGVVGERGSGRCVERKFVATKGLEARV